MARRQNTIFIPQFSRSLKQFSFPPRWPFNVRENCVREIGLFTRYLFTLCFTAGNNGTRNEREKRDWSASLRATFSKLLRLELKTRREKIVINRGSSSIEVRLEGRERKGDSRAGRKAGISGWKQSCSNRKLEVAKWHLGGYPAAFLTTLGFLLVIRRLGH